MNKTAAIFTGNSNPALAKEIVGCLKMSLSKVLVTRFSEGEIRVRIDENVRGKDVFIVQSTCPPPNRNLMELLILIDALKRASARRITAVLPHFGYARQDRKDQPRVPITAKLVANLLTTAGADRILTIDLHAGQIQGFFDIPMDHLYAVKVFVDHIKQMKIKNITVASPDVGGIKMARAYAKRLETPLAIVDKRRISEEDTEVMNILGEEEIKGKNVLIIDDLVATAGSLVEAANALKKAGAKDVYAAITHPILSGPAIKRIEASPIKKLFVTNTIPVEDGKIHKKIKVLSIAPLLADAIKRIHNEESVSCLFD
ncbi:MAG: ribose-phosphate pyrophosphokinase [Candidatus Omnitrophica bacterium]|nr:ribose-phosphate pyrophosphokinase [Candidatus Omnitrophota bacterium]MBU4589686.1 ribose-phosphate pyrophosphokinase [Candidatus Omnitrophota bacterium]